MEIENAIDDIIRAAEKPTLIDLFFQIKGAEPFALQNLWMRKIYEVVGDCEDSTGMLNEQGEPKP